MTELCTTTNRLEHQKRANFRPKQKEELLVGIEGTARERCSPERKTQGRLRRDPVQRLCHAKSPC